MNVYRITQADRDLLLTGADLEAVLADREREKLERDERTQALLRVGAIERLVQQVPGTEESQYAPSEPITA